MNDDDEGDGAEVQDIPDEVRDVPAEDDLDCGPSEEDMQEWELAA